jgi:hypothetical protein
VESRDQGAGGEDRVAFVWLYILLCSAIWTPIGAVWVLVTGESPTWWWLGAPLVSAVLHVVYSWRCSVVTPKAT